MDYEENPSEYLATVSPHRLNAVKYPKQSWKGRARCFRLFNNGSTPSNISPRQCKVSRRTLYKYYQDWKILRARLLIVIREARQEWEQKHGAERMITIKDMRP